jgi:rhamnogalacturonan endolyase
MTTPMTAPVRAVLSSLGVATLLATGVMATSGATRLPAESLGRGLVALQTEGRVVLSWRLLARDPADVAFHAYASTNGGAGLVRLTSAPLKDATFFSVPEAEIGAVAPTAGEAPSPVTFTVRPVVDGREQEADGRFTLAADSRGRPYLRVPLQTPTGYAPNDGSVGDLDGDGEYEIVLHQAGRGRDNAQAGFTDPPILQAYRLDGTRLWEIQLGRNIREGAHYTQFLVFDLDGDGRAEVACKTADGTVDGQGKVVGDGAADHVTKEGRAQGKILDGPEFLTVFDGRTGAALATTEYLPPRGEVASWGDDYGNRVDRFLGAIAYLDGQRPSLVMARGYYTRSVVVAWDWRDGKWTTRWVFDSDAGDPANRTYRAQGNHGLAVADVDGDGRDEIVYGACVIDDDGRGLYSTRLGHGDALHLADLDPDRPGLEVFGIHEKPGHGKGVTFRDARAGTVLWSRESADVGRGLAADIDPRHPGAECWAAGAGLNALFDCRGAVVSERRPRSVNFAVWWDGDLLRELLDRTTISKWDWTRGVEVPLLVAEGCTANNGTKATPVLSADLLGDWREEVIWRSADNRELRLYTTPLPTPHRFRSLMQDPQYRLAVAWQNVGYNQPPHPATAPGR